MKLNDLMEIVHKAYPDELTREYWESIESRMDPLGSGDTLAEFVVREIADTYDSGATDKEQLYEAARVIRRAENDCARVAEALEMFKPESKQ
jgi:uncharacterized protein YqgQ